MEDNNILNFEEAIKELEKISDELGRENISLDDALKLYEKGIKLVRECNEKLAQAQRTIKILQTDSDGVISENDFKM